MLLHVFRCVCRMAKCDSIHVVLFQQMHMLLVANSCYWLVGGWHSALVMVVVVAVLLALVTAWSIWCGLGIGLGNDNVMAVLT